MKWIDRVENGEVKRSAVKVGEFELVIHRHRDWPDDMWLASCGLDLFFCKPLVAKELSSAKHEAIFILKIILEAALGEIEKGEI